MCVWSTVLGCGGILNREQERASAAETMFGPHRALRLVVVVVVVVPAAASFAGKRKHGDSTCWTALGEKNIPNVVEADCKHRFQSLREAMAVCEKLDGCEGVVRDGGVHCPPPTPSTRASGLAALRLSSCTTYARARRATGLVGKSGRGRSTARQAAAAPLEPTPQLPSSVQTRCTTIAAKRTRRRPSSNVSRATSLPMGLRHRARSSAALRRKSL